MHPCIHASMHPSIHTPIHAIHAIHAIHDIITWHTWHTWHTCHNCMTYITCITCMTCMTYMYTCIHVYVCMYVYIYVYHDIYAYIMIWCVSVVHLTNLDGTDRTWLPEILWTALHVHALSEPKRGIEWLMGRHDALSASFLRHATLIANTFRRSVRCEVRQIWTDVFSLDW